MQTVYRSDYRRCIWRGLMRHSFRYISAAGAFILAAALMGCAGATTPAATATVTIVPSATVTEAGQGGEAPVSSSEPQNTPTYVLPPPTGGVVGGPAAAGTGTDVTGLPTGQSGGAAGPPSTDENGEL